MAKAKGKKLTTYLSHTPQQTAICNRQTAQRPPLGPGHWFDPDQLVVGNFGLSWEQARAQMAIWSIWSAPLYMSVDLRSIEPEMGALLRNERLIEVNQDPFGVFGLMTQQSADHSLQAFVKPVRPVAADGCPSFAIVYLNRNSLGGRAKVSVSVARASCR